MDKIEKSATNHTSIIINNKVFNYVKTREYTPVSVFKSDDEFLRIGPKDLLEPELDFQKKLLDYNFPIPKIIAEGEYNNEFYFIEESLGNVTLADLFWEDNKTQGYISDEHFASFLAVSKEYAKAQLKTSTDERDDESFYMGIHMNDILEELPELKEDIIVAFGKLIKRTSVLPFVLTHGDLNAYNILEKGVIDFGGNFNAPAGYDLVTNIYHTYMFPDAEGCEADRRYQFSEKQISEYLAMLDDVYLEEYLQKPTDFKDDFIFARAIWATVKMQEYPKIQKWRYDKFKKLLSEYLNGESLVQTTLNL